MKIYLIRHGQTNWNVAGRIQGSTDTDLNEDGLLQAKELSRQITEESYGITKIYSSPLKRAYQTAQIIGEALDDEVIVMNNFSEMNFGKWEGLNWNQVKRDYAEEYTQWRHNRRYTSLPEGESYQETLVRVVEGLRQISQEQGGEAGNIAVVTHSAVIRCIQCFVTDTPFHEMKKFKLENAAIVEIDSDMLDKEL